MVKLLNEQKTTEDRPLKPCVIADCGELPANSPLTVPDPFPVRTILSICRKLL